MSQSIATDTRLSGISIPAQIRAQSGSVVEVHTSQGVAVLTRKQADRVLRGAELVKTFEGWRVRR